MQRIHIVGSKNSGKTTLIVELVSYLTSLGYRVGTIKHTHHHHELDTPGKDSHCHREAGSAVVGILSPGMSAVFWPAAREEDCSDHYDQLSASFADCDLVLVEGDLQTDQLKIEVWREATGVESFAASDTSIAAVVTDDPLDNSLPVLKRSDISSIASWLITAAEGAVEPVSHKKRTYAKLT